MDTILKQYAKNGKLILSFVSHNPFEIRIFLLWKLCTDLWYILRILWQHASIFIGLSKSFASFCFRIHGRRVGGLKVNRLFFYASM